MRRWTTTIAALVVLLSASSGWARDGYRYFTRTIDFPVVDSGHAVNAEANGAVSSINDSLYYTFREFTYNGPWTDLSVNFTLSTKDTTTATGLYSDSVTWHLQTQLENDSSNWWSTIAVTARTPMLSWDSTGSVDTLTGAAGFYNAPTVTSTAGVGIVYTALGNGVLRFSKADSVNVHQGSFRVMAHYTAEEDSLESDCALRSATTFHPMEVFRAHIRFELR